MVNLQNDIINNDLRRDNAFPSDSRKGWPWNVKSSGIETFDPDISWPKISIVTPSFNQGQYIEQTIRSVLSQGYPNLEYIIIDGGSADDTISIIKKYEPWLTYWISEPDKGQSDAINKGLERCTGEIFNWLNSDDWYEPNALFSIAKAFMDHSTAQVISGFENRIETDGSVTLDKGTFLAKTLEETIEMCQVTQPSTFFKTKSIKQLGSIPEDIDYIMDGEIWVRILLMYGSNCFYKISKPLVNFRLHESSKTTSNAVVDNFLVERSSIIIDLQRYTRVPEKIISYWLENIYRTNKYLELNRRWQINKHIVSSERIRNYFIKKYISLQFQNRNLKNAFWALKVLIKKGVFDAFVVKGLMKLVAKALWK